MFLPLSDKVMPPNIKNSPFLARRLCENKTPRKTPWPKSSRSVRRIAAVPKSIYHENTDWCSNCGRDVAGACGAGDAGVIVWTVRVAYTGFAANAGVTTVAVLVPIDTLFTDGVHIGEDIGPGDIHGSTTVGECCGVRVGIDIVWCVTGSLTSWEDRRWQRTCRSRAGRTRGGLRRTATTAEEEGGVAGGDI